MTNSSDNGAPESGVDSLSVNDSELNEAMGEATHLANPSEVITKPVIALVGRPNVGKSTLFNRVTRSRDALVANFPGLTRDRQYGEALVGDHAVIVIDTAGIVDEEEGVDRFMVEQSMQAVEEADVVFLLVDAQQGLNASDERLAERLRSQNKRTQLVINKVDRVDPDVAVAEFAVLGLGEPFCIAAVHGRGVSSMMHDCLLQFGLDPTEGRDVTQMGESAEDAEHGIKIAFVGRPNVGKSTMTNRMLGEERVVVYDAPGTTRDSVYIPFERRGRQYTLIDTAGVRRRGKVSETVEKFSVVKTLKAMQDANVVVLVLDASEGIVEQDLHLLGFALESGRALVIALNKWDGLDADFKDRLRKTLRRRFEFCDWARIHFVSALHGTGIGDLYGSVDKAYRSAMATFSTNKLTAILENCVVQHQPPLVRGRRIKLRYAHMGGSNPPRIIVHGNQTSSVPDSYQRYLENSFRRQLKLEGTPVSIEFKTGDNPYAGKRNKLTPRQQQKRRRMMAHYKKQENKRRKK